MDIRSSLAAQSYAAARPATDPAPQPGGAALRAGQAFADTLK